MTRKQLWLGVQYVFFTIAVVYFGLKIRSEWGDLTSLPSTLHPNWLMVLGSAGWVALSYAVLIETWRQIVIAWGGKLSWPAAARIWFISNLGRYVPGKVWQIGAMGALAQEAGVGKLVERVVDGGERDPDAVLGRHAVEFLGGDVNVAALQQKLGQGEPLAGGAEALAAETVENVAERSVHGSSNGGDHVRVTRPFSTHR